MKSYLARHRLVWVLLLVAVVAFVAIGVTRLMGTSNATSQLSKDIQLSNEPVSLTATNPQFSNDGHISVRTNITDTSQVEILQVNGNIGSTDMGACYLNIPGNETSTCLLGEGPASPVSCAGLGVGPGYELTLKAIFVNGRTITETYPVTASELGCR
jgi:hypothetical protein